MKIDLHCHTKKTKKSDGINRNVDVTTFAKYMKDLDIKIVAITNHNLFDKKQYEEFEESVKDYCDRVYGVLPCRNPIYNKTYVGILVVSILINEWRRSV